jgi:diguanylate cyclase (GGDEF)-like protein
VVLFAWVLLCSRGVQAQNDIVGDPFERRYSPEELNVYPQNFDLVEDRQGLIYVANSEGVLEFDGARWAKIDLPEGEFARSLGLGSDGKVYVGSFNHFGFLERDADRDQQARLGDVWDVVPSDRGVFFTTRFQLFLWDEAPLNTWSSETGFGNFAFAGGRYLIREKEVGLRELVGDEFRTIPGSEMFADGRLNAITPLLDGRILLVGESDYYVLDGDRISPFEPAHRNLPDASQVYRAQLLGNGDVAFGTTIGSIFLLSADGRSGRAYGLSDYIISGLMVSQDGALWAATDEDIVRLSIPSPWSYFGSQYGFNGFVTDTERYQGGRVIATNSGVYRMTLDPGNEGRPSFERLNWGNNEFWNLLDTPYGLLVAESYVVKQVVDDVPEPITETLYPRRLIQSSQDPDLVFVAGETGFATLVAEDGRWTTRGDFTERDIRAYYLVESGPRELWIGTYGNSVYRVQLSSDYARIESMEQFDEGDGLRLDVTRGVVVSNVLGTMSFSSEKGIFQYNGEVFVPAFDPPLQAYLKQERPPRVEFTSANGREVWASTGREVFRGLFRDGRWNWKKLHLGPFDNTAVEALVFDEGTVWIGAAAALLRFETDFPERPPATAEIDLRSMEVRKADQSVQRMEILGGGSLAIPWTPQTISLKYAVPGQSGGEIIEYRTQLEGFDTKWTSWGKTPESAYTGLNPGWYLFRAQARTASGALPGEASIAFQITPPSYRSPLAYTIYMAAAGVLLALVTWAVVRWRSRYLRMMNRRLERQIAQRSDALRQRSEELERANMRLRQMAEQDGLTGVANRRRLDTYLQECWRRCREQHTPLTVLMIDADRFKTYNDKHGHLAGDEVLKSLSNVMRTQVRDERHLLSRYGGGQFALVLPDYEIDAAVSYAELLRLAVDEAGEQTCGITVSVGVGQISPYRDEDIETLLERADAALFQAKGRGRNCVAS